MWPIVSTCGMATYQLVKFLTKILQKYTGIAPFVKDSKGFSQNLRSVHLGQDEELVSFDMSALFTSINWLFTEDIEVSEVKGKYSCTFEENTVGLKKNEVMNLLKLVLGKLRLFVPRELLQTGIWSRDRFTLLTGSGKYLYGIHWRFSIRSRTPHPSQGMEGVCRWHLQHHS